VTAGGELVLEDAYRFSLAVQDAIERVAALGHDPVGMVHGGNGIKDTNIEREDMSSPYLSLVREKRP
jgi:hypothetical protein